MTTAAVAAQPSSSFAISASAPIRIALLGLGQVGCALATLTRDSAAGSPFTLASALVRMPQRERPIDTSHIPLTTEPSLAIPPDADVVVELLGGLEPARTLILAALANGTPVVTANKTLLAVHGDELFAAAARTRTPLLYEASVLAGVPFLSTFGRRPHARDVVAVSGIVNGTSNFILSRMASEGLPFAAALAEAQRAGYAEADPTKDVEGEDAAEKLCVLVRHFGGISVAPAAIERTGIGSVDAFDLECAAAFGGAIRPVAVAEWNGDAVSAFTGPAFVAGSHPLARIDGVQNAVTLRTRRAGDLLFSGPGAGPAVTAATVLDDVVEVQRTDRRGDHVPAARAVSSLGAPETGWFICLDGDDLADAHRAAGTLGTLGIRVRRTSPIVQREGRQRQWLLTGSCAQAHAAAAVDVLASRVDATARLFRALE